MKTKKLFKLGIIIPFALGLFLVMSCNQGLYDDYDNTQIIKNTYTGSVDDFSGDSDPDANFTGDNDSGILSFAWINSSTKAKVKLDISSSSSGSVKLTLNDSNGKEVFNKTFSSSDNVLSFDGLTDEGDAGTWKVTLEFSNFTGQGSFEIDDN